MNLLLLVLLIVWVIVGVVWHLFVYAPRAERNRRGVLEAFVKSEGCTLRSFKRVYRPSPLNSSSPREFRFSGENTDNRETLLITAHAPGGDTRQAYVRLNCEGGLAAWFDSLFITGPLFYVEASLWLDEVTAADLKKHTTIAWLTSVGGALFFAIIAVLLASHEEAKSRGQSGHFDFSWVQRLFG